MNLAIQTRDREILFLVNENEHQEIEKVHKKIDKMIQHHIKKNFSDLPILPMMAVSEYPADTSDPVQLLNSVRAKLTQMAFEKGHGDME